jgi:pimeloyl-ACP methyl ester carboxylesterase
VNGPSVFGPGGSIHDDPKKAEKANPISYINESSAKRTPPFLIMHGDADTLVLPNQTKFLHEALVKYGVDSTYYLVKVAGHGGPHWVQPEITNIIIDFLNKHLKGKK